jgi:CubicO group peptidase (beta-lactamase class C family)
VSDTSRVTGAQTRRAFLRSAALATAGLSLAPRAFATEPASAAGADLADFIRDRLPRTHCPAVSAVAVFGGAVVWSRAFGTANVATGRRARPDTVFNIASVSKTITGTAVLQACERGLLSLDADVNDVLGFDVRNPAFPGEPITTRMLLTHTASVRDCWATLLDTYVQGDPTIGLRRFLRGYFEPGGRWWDATRNFTHRPPGADYAYANIGVALAGYLVEAASGIPLDEWCRTEIFEPLGMADTGWFLAGLDRARIARPYAYRYASGSYHSYGLYGYPDYPDGLLRTTPTALGAFLGMITNGGNSPGGRILQQQTVDEMLTDQIGPNVGGWQGLIWYRMPSNEHEDLFGHQGGDYGVWSEMLFRRSDGAGAVVVANGDAYRHDERVALLEIRNRLIEDAPIL